MTAVKVGGFRCHKSGKSGARVAAFWVLDVSSHIPVFAFADALDLRLQPQRVGLSARGVDCGVVL